MSGKALSGVFDELETPFLADACVRLDVVLRTAPAGIRSVPAGARIQGRVLPVRHYGSVDVFLEAMEAARPGKVLLLQARVLRSKREVLVRLRDFHQSRIEVDRALGPSRGPAEGG